MAPPLKYQTEEERKEVARVRKRNAYRLKHNIPLDCAPYKQRSEEERLERKREYDKRYREEHREHLKELQKQYYQKRKILKTAQN